jgi:hypothetical protein
MGIIGLKWIQRRAIVTDRWNDYLFVFHEQGGSPMNSLLRLGFIALAMGAMLQARADSLASSASSAGSESSGSVSDSVHSSSNSSSKKDKVANRDYHVVDVAALPGRAGMARVTMQADDADWRVMLDLPQTVVDREKLRNGAMVHAQERVYGIEFEHGDTREGFFLALNDNWTDELAARKVSL